MKFSRWYGCALLGLGAVLVVSGCSGGGGDTTPSACANVTCTAPAASCDGDTAVSYTGDGVCDPNGGTCSYANVEVRERCGDRGLVCQGGACVDPCADVSCAAPPADTCDGDTAVTHEASGTCDPSTLACTYAETRTDCTASNQICTDGACVDPGPCYQVTCGSPPSATCDGTEAVTYADTGTCQPADGTCEYAEASRTDCAGQGLACDAGTCVDACVGVTCEAPPAATCDGEVAVTYASSGTCDGTSGECTYAETRTDCTGTGSSCQGGGCVSSLVVSEIMFHPAIPDADGEWFELHNVGSAAIDLTRYTFADDGTDRFTVPATAGLTIPAGGYVVLGRNGDPNVNGGVTEDYSYGDAMNLANDGDQVIVEAPDGTVLDRVDYTGGPTWPMPFAASLQFDASAPLDASTNGDAAHWCPARTDYGPTGLQRGTPGAANVDCMTTPVVLTIQDLQDPSSPNHPVEQTLVRIEGVAAVYMDPTGGWVEDPAGGRYSGIHHVLNGVDRTGIYRSHVVNIEGYYEELYGAAQIKVTRLEDTGEIYDVRPVLVTSAELADPATAEAFEGVLVRLDDVAVTSDELLGGTGPLGPEERQYVLDGRVRVDDFLTWTVSPFEGQAAVHPYAMCQVWSHIAGILNYADFRWVILSRDPAADLGTVQDAVDASAVASSGTGFTPAAICVPEGTQVTWSNAGTADLNVSSYDPRAPGTATGTDIDLTVPAGGTASQSFATSGGYPYLAAGDPGAQGIVVVHQ